MASVPEATGRSTWPCSTGVARSASDTPMWRGWRLYMDRNDRLTGIAALGVLTVLVNGIFQEEALFSPLALGVMMGILGLVLGRALRPNARIGVAATRVDHLAKPFAGAAGR